MVFRVRSAKAVKITDASLLKRLGIICLCVGIGLLIRTIVAPPVVIVGRTADDLKAYLCKADWWDHTFTTSKCCVSFTSFHLFLPCILKHSVSSTNWKRFSPKDQKSSGIYRWHKKNTQKTELFQNTWDISTNCILYDS